METVPGESWLKTARILSREGHVVVVLDYQQLLAIPTPPPKK